MTLKETYFAPGNILHTKDGGRYMVLGAGWNRKAVRETVCNNDVDAISIICPYLLNIDNGCGYMRVCNYDDNMNCKNDDINSEIARGFDIHEVYNPSGSKIWERKEDVENKPVFEVGERVLVLDESGYSFAGEEVIIDCIAPTVALKLNPHGFVYYFHRKGEDKKYIAFENHIGKIDIPESNKKCKDEDEFNKGVGVLLHCLKTRCPDCILSYENQDGQLCCTALEKGEEEAWNILNS